MNFALSIEGEAVGGVTLRSDPDTGRRSAEICFWLGPTHWNQGIMSEALRMVTMHAFSRLGLARIYALPPTCNPAAARVLEKSGFEREGTLRRSMVKNGALLDRHLYAAIEAVAKNGIVDGKENRAGV